jgi:hypothetical protein
MANNQNDEVWPINRFGVLPQYGSGVGQLPSPTRGNVRSNPSPTAAEKRKANERAERAARAARRDRAQAASTSSAPKKAPTVRAKRIAAAARRDGTRGDQELRASGEGREEELARLIRKAEQGKATAEDEKRMIWLYSATRDASGGGTSALSAPIGRKEATINQPGKNTGRRRADDDPFGGLEAAIQAAAAKLPPKAAAAPANDLSAALNTLARDPSLQPAADGGGGSDGGLAALIAALPPINRDSYVGPYDQAMGLANEAHGRAVPAIQQIFGGLQDKMGALGADYNQQHQGQQAQMGQQHQQQMGDLQQVASSGLEGLQAQGVDVGSLLARTAEAGGQAAAGLSANQALGASSLDRAQQLQQLSMNERQADVPSMEAAGLSTAQNNLTSVLQQLGFKKAGAEQDYNSDMAERQFQIAKLTQDFASQQAGDAAAAEDRAFEVEKRDWEREDRAKANMASADPRATWVGQTLPSLSSGAQSAMTEFINLLDPAYKGASGYTKASAMVDEADDDDLMKQFGFKVDKGRVKQYLRDYFGVG